VTVPSVVNLSEQAAKDQLEAAGFKVKPRDDYSDEVQTGFVIRQDPEGKAKVAQGETVDIWVCRGALTITLIDLRNMKSANVVAWLAQNGLKGDPRNGASTSVATGRVYKQDPAVGQTVARGGTVTYWVSQGKPQVRVPEVTGLPLNDATKVIQDAGFKLGRVDPRFDATVANGLIIEQNPGANIMVEKGATIDLVVSSGPSPSPTPSVTPTLVAVPDVVTLLQADAEADLTDAGFFVDFKYKPSIQPPGTVVRQKPRAGTMLPVGSTVTITLAT
jgi:serine/threonine-protein kinase